MIESKRVTILSIAFLILLFVYANVFAQPPRLKGKYTNEFKEPKIAHAQNQLPSLKVRRMRGKLSLENEVPLNSIVSVWRIDGDKSKFLFSYLVGANGKFDFKKLKPGQYLLKTGTTDGYFNANYIEILLAPFDKDSSKEEIETDLEVGT